jgi:hypothetical protein
VLEAAWWGFVGGAALLLGATVGVFWQVPHRIVGLVMAFGAGVLFSALAFELTAEAYLAGGAPPVGCSPAPSSTSPATSGSTAAARTAARTRPARRPARPRPRSSSGPCSTASPSPRRSA